MKTTRVVGWALLLGLAGLPGFGETLWQDDFATARRYERWGDPCWTLGQGQAACRAPAGESFLVAIMPQLRTLTISADLTATSRTGNSWTVAGLALFNDPSNHWRLLLVEGPDGRKYFELIEKLNGEHQAQNGITIPAARLEAAASGELKSWEYGRRYHLQLALTPEGVAGTVTDTASQAFWRLAFTFNRARAVRTGRAALMTQGTTGAFQTFRAEGERPAAAGTVQLQPGPAGTVALIPDEPNQVAPELARALTAAGYGVTVVPWEQLDRDLPSPDLLVLADARRTPTAAKDQVMATVHSAGKVLCIGAPAFAELLAPSPEGWKGAADWARAYFDKLVRRPIALTPDQWSRSTNSRERASAIAPDPDSGPAAWKVTTDLEGWDTYTAPIPGAFDRDHQVLAFEARGDAQTTQLCIECTETDGSRWIATVDLATRWQAYVLRAVDFPYWKDSRSQNRGGAGDRLRPEQVASIAIGLASSHTHSVRPGPHTYWLRGLSTAADNDLPEPDFQVSDLETVCPSYKLYPMEEIAQLRPAAGQELIPAGKPVRWTDAAFSPIWRERGRGFHRARPWRWLPLLEAVDAGGRSRGAVLSLMLGDAVCPNAAWGNVAVADARQALRPELLPQVVRMARAMTDGTFLLDGGAELFSYKPGETVRLGATGLNLGRVPQTLGMKLTVRSAAGKVVFQQSREARLEPGATAELTGTWTPRPFDPRGYEVTTVFTLGGQVRDRIAHRIEAVRTAPAKPEEFVRVKGSEFTLGGKPWHFKGINYWQSHVGGYPHLGLYQRGCYDPEVVERDLSFLQSLGVNALSAVQALLPPNPEDPLAYRDQLDFLDRCSRHGMKVFFFLRDGRPYYGGEVAKIKEYITRAGIKDHPAIMCWELAWEPIDVNWQGRFDAFLGDWNKWIGERYGSVAHATADWGFAPELTPEGQVPLPTVTQCSTHGAWDRYVAAFRRAFSDEISHRYRDLAQPLRAWDPQHLVSFRGGACGIPSGANFAHIHSAGAAKHMDFLNPEGYNLQTSGHGTPTPPDEIRQGGLVTQFCRFASREKPIVWMEFGYTVQGINTDWRPELVRVTPQQLQHQAAELERFYQMFLESGARGAAPWWLPGGFRLGENSDFGVIEPDGTARPAAEVMRRYLPQFAQVQHAAPNVYLDWDLETRYADAWQQLAPQYLAAVKAGKTVGLRTTGTGTDSLSCPLTAVGGGPVTGHNPPLYLNAEFNRLEVKIGSGPWREVKSDGTLTGPMGAKVLCRASVGNLGEATWLVGEGPGRVCLAGRAEYGLAFSAPLAGQTPYLGDATVPEFVLLPALPAGQTTVSCELLARGRAYFGERRTVSFVASAR